MLTDDEIKAIETRAEAATPGPWWSEDGTNLGHAYIAALIPSGRPNGEIIGTIGAHNPSSHPEVRPVQDATFIAAARQDVPALLADRAELVTRIQRLESDLRIAEGRLETIVELSRELRAYSAWHSSRPTLAPWPQHAADLGTRLDGLLEGE